MRDKDCSGCGHLDNDFCSIAKYAGTKCEDNPNCYYKQLQASRKENTALKQQIKLKDEALEAYFDNTKSLKDIDNIMKTALDKIKYNK